MPRTRGRTRNRGTRPRVPTLAGSVSPPTIETARLRLRPFAAICPTSMRHGARVGDPVSMRWYPAPFDRDATRRWIERQLERYETDGVGLLAIEDATTGELLGDCGPVVPRRRRGTFLELGWHVLPFAAG